MRIVAFILILIIAIGTLAVFGYAAARTATVVDTAQAQTAQSSADNRWLIEQVVRMADADRALLVQALRNQTRSPSAFVILCAVIMLGCAGYVIARRMIEQRNEDRAVMRALLLQSAEAHRALMRCAQWDIIAHAQFDVAVIDKNTPDVYNVEIYNQEER